MSSKRHISEGNKTSTRQRKKEASVKGAASPQLGVIENTKMKQT